MIMGDLNGKTALVTGSSRGIGRGIAQRLAQDGALVAVHYGNNDTAAKETAETIRGAGGRAFIIGAELGVPGDAETLFAAFDDGLRPAARSRASTSSSTTPPSACRDTSTR